MEITTYQDYALMGDIRDAIRPHLKSGERIIWRDAFRWKDDSGNILPNHYEMFDLDSLSAQFGFTVVHDFRHVAVIRT